MNRRPADANLDLERAAARRDYATPEDFCAIFEEEMNRLYSLAVLLTGDHPAAEECFLAALDECRHSSNVFREWARYWSRRAIIQRAIQQVRPRPEAGAAEKTARERDGGGDIPRSLLQLPPFERFVFGMAVLEGYSAHECATLLDCRAREVERARIAALRSLGGSRGDGPAAPFAGYRSNELVATADIGGTV